MERYIRGGPDYTTYYNCSFSSPDEWYTYRHPNKPLGFTYMALGLFTEVAYLACLYVMGGTKWMKLSCYKMMFYMGIVDMSNLVNVAILPGYWLWHGYVYCDAPNAMYLSGAAIICLWCSASMNCMMLCTNRCIDLLCPALMELLFAGHKTYLWIAASFCYGLYFYFFTTPFIFSSALGGNIVDPFVNTPYSNPTVYTNMAQAIHNMLVVVVLFVNYAVIIGYVCYKESRFSMRSRSKISPVQKQIIAQAMMICMFFFVGCIIYVKMQFFDTPMYMVAVGQLLFVCCHGCSVIIYLFLNKTMRNEIRRKFLPHLSQSAVKSLDQAKGTSTVDDNGSHTLY